MKFSRFFIDAALMVLLIGMLILPVGSFVLVKPPASNSSGDVLSIEDVRESILEKINAEEVKESTESTNAANSLRN